MRVPDQADGRRRRQPQDAPLERGLPDRIRGGYGFAPVPPQPIRSALVSGGATYVKRAVLPFTPARLRLVPAARAA